MNINYIKFKELLFNKDYIIFKILIPFNSTLTNMIMTKKLMHNIKL